MFTYERYRELFGTIDAALWDVVVLRDKDGGVMAKDDRVEMLTEEMKRAKSVIAAYIDAKAAMMMEIICNDRFSWIPMPETPARRETQSADPLLRLLVSAASETQGE